MRIEDNTIIQSLEHENADVKQGAVIYLLTESFAMLQHIYEMDPESQQCRMLTEDLAELFATSKAYCIEHQLNWEECKRRITDMNLNKELKIFIDTLMN